MSGSLTDEPRLRDDVEQALERIFASSAFARSPQLIAMLTYITGLELEGRGDRIKGYSIAVEALGKPASFDANVDPIVRVEARRLRTALKNYYEAEGAEDELVIRLPTGSYRPIFTYPSLDDPVEEPEPALPAQEAETEILPPERALAAALGGRSGS